MRSFIELKPDLVLAWESGTPVEVIARLEDMGLRVVVLNTDNLAAIAATLREIGRLTGRISKKPNKKPSAFEQGVAELRDAAAGRATGQCLLPGFPRTVIYYHRGSMSSVNRSSCAAGAIFLPTSPAPVRQSPSRRSSKLRREVIIASGAIRVRTIEESHRNTLDFWRRWQSIPAVQRNAHLYYVDANLMNRASLRILEGIRQLCDRIDRVR